MTKSELELVKSKLTPNQLDSFKRKWLREYRFIIDKIETYKEEIEYYKSSLNTMTANYSQERVQHSPSRPDSMWARIIDKTDLITENFEKICANAEKEICDITSAIESLADEKQKMVLILRYIKGLSYQEIAEDRMNYSEINIHKIQQKAIRNIELPDYKLEAYLNEK